MCRDNKRIKTNNKRSLTFKVKYVKSNNLNIKEVDVLDFNHQFAKKQN